MSNENDELSFLIGNRNIISPVDELDEIGFAAGAFGTNKKLLSQIKAGYCPPKDVWEMVLSKAVEKNDLRMYMYAKESLREKPDPHQVQNILRDCCKRGDVSTVLLAYNVLKIDVGLIHKHCLIYCRALAQFKGRLSRTSSTLHINELDDIFRANFKIKPGVSISDTEENKRTTLLTVSSLQRLKDYFVSINDTQGVTIADQCSRETSCLDVLLNGDRL